MGRTASVVSFITLFPSATTMKMERKGGFCERVELFIKEMILPRRKTLIQIELNNILRLLDITLTGM
jgi:hypothetical protein